MMVIGVIPARYASKRLPAKAIIDLKGKPMIQRVYEQAMKATKLNRVVVATDDERVEKVVKRFGGEVVMTPSEIPTGSDRVAAVADKIDGNIFVNIQGDEPLIHPKMIIEGVSVLADDPDVRVGTLIRRIQDPAELASPAVVKVVRDTRGDALYFSRSPIPFLRDEKDRTAWVAREEYYKHIGLYVFRRDFLKEFSLLQRGRLERTEMLEQLRILEAGYRIRTGVTDYDSIPVDTQDDVVKVLRLIED